jgi:hypothetical protein
MSDTVLSVPAASPNLIARYAGHYFLRSATSFPRFGTGARRAEGIRAFGAQENAFLDGQRCTCVLSPCGSERIDPLQFQAALLFLH